MIEMDEKGNLIEPETEEEKKKQKQYIVTEQGDDSAALGFTTPDSAQEF